MNVKVFEANSVERLNSDLSSFFAAHDRSVVSANLTVAEERGKYLITVIYTGPR